jgi:hypothetical protein
MSCQYHCLIATKIPKKSIGGDAVDLRSQITCVLCAKDHDIWSNAYKEIDLPNSTMSPMMTPLRLNIMYSVDQVPRQAK